MTTRATIGIIVVVALVLLKTSAHATGDPSTSRLLGWSADGTCFATLEDMNGHSEFAVEVHQFKNGKQEVVLRIQEECHAKSPVPCKTLPRKAKVEFSQEIRRVGPKHPLLKRYKLQPVDAAWRTNYKTLALRFKKAGKRKFLSRREQETSWRIEASGKNLGYVMRGDADLGGSSGSYTTIRGGYLQDSGTIALLKFKERNEGYRHREFYLAVHITKSTNRSLH